MGRAPHLYLSNLRTLTCQFNSLDPHDPKPLIESRWRSGAHHVLPGKRVDQVERRVLEHEGSAGAAIVCDRFV